MRLCKIPVRITLTKKCREGFYLIVNGSRIRFATKALAVAALKSVLQLQRFQIVSVRELADGKKAKLPKVKCGGCGLWLTPGCDGCSKCLCKKALTDKGGAQ